MSRRIDSHLLLVGSLPSETAEDAFRQGAELFGDLVFALPDGETGPLGAWVGFEREQLVRPNPDVVVVEETASPTGRPRHAFETPIFAIKEGVDELRWDTWPRIDAAIESYELFKRLRDEGAIPAGLRFQVGLPFPDSALNAFKANFEHDYPIAERAYVDLVSRELDRLLDAIPAQDLALQWDCAYETLDIEGVLPWTTDGAWDRFTGPIPQLTAKVPEEALMGFHLCYGTLPEWPMLEARDFGLVVEMANAAVERAARPVDWVHLAGPRYMRSEDERFFAPLEGLRADDTRVFLGLILPVDGIPGLERRHRTAKRHLDDFGVAMYCGFGRQPGVDPRVTLEEHAATARSVL